MNVPVSSDRACDRCRERRVKCDKRHPECHRCEKLGKPCPGYAKKRKFVDQGETLRRKFEQASTTPKSDSGHSFEQDGQIEPPTATSDATNPQTRSQLLQFSVTTRPQQVNTEPVLSTDGQYNATDYITTLTRAEHDDAIILPLSGLVEHVADDVLDEPVADAYFDPKWFNLDPVTFYNQAGNSCGFLPNAPDMVADVDRRDPSSTFDMMKTFIAGQDDLPLPRHDWNSWINEKQLQTSQIISDEREHEMAYLVRHFSECIGPWMDLFDCERHFAQLVPLKALRDVLLKYAIAAVAAKQLGCIKGSRPFMSPQNQKPADMELMDYADSTDWFYKAANYYDKAIMYSRVYLQQLSGSMVLPPSTTTGADSDDLSLAVSIFSLYEYLDNADLGWTQHLAGLKSILSVSRPSTPSPIPPSVSQTALARRALFWNFARADYQAAYINKTSTLLDTANLAIWQDAGLEIQPDGSIYADPESLAQDRTALSHSNQLVSHTLLWILLKTMNFLFATTPFREHDSDRAKEWLQLIGMLDAWQAARPQSFQPCARLRHNVKRIDVAAEAVTAATAAAAAAAGEFIHETFFSIPLCAATVQLYHFTRLLLLTHKPASVEETVAAAAAAAKVEIGDNTTSRSEILAHSYTILGIALGRPHPAVRVEMILPLYLAGCWLEDNDERQIVVDTLHAIGKDTGCEAGGRIRQLTSSWGWESTTHTRGR